MRPEFDTEVIRLECGSNIRVPELGCRGKGSLTWTGNLTPEDGRSMLLRNTRTHRARLKATTPCRRMVVLSSSGQSVKRGTQFAKLHNTTEFIERTLCFPRIGGKRNAYGISPAIP